MTESSSVTTKNSLKLIFKCQAEVWQVCCTNSNSVNIQSYSMNSTDVLWCRSLTGLLFKLKSDYDPGEYCLFAIGIMTNLPSEQKSNYASYGMNHRVWAIPRRDTMQKWHLFRKNEKFTKRSDGFLFSFI